MKTALSWELIILRRNFKMINLTHLETKVEAITVLVQKAAQTVPKTALLREEEKVRAHLARTMFIVKKNSIVGKNISGGRQLKSRKTSYALMQNAENFMAAKAV
jgi:hypothetical protein